MHLVSASPNGELTRVLRATFSTSGVIWSERSEATHVLYLGPEAFSRRNLSVNAEARAAEFDLVMRASFRVVDQGNKPLMPDTQAVVNKQMENDPRNVVGKEEEVRVLRGRVACRPRRPDLSSHQLLRRQQRRRDRQGRRRRMKASPYRPRQPLPERSAPARR